MTKVTNLSFLALIVNELAVELVLKRFSRTNELGSVSFPIQSTIIQHACYLWRFVWCGIDDFIGARGKVMQDWVREITKV